MIKLDVFEIKKTSVIKNSDIGAPFKVKGGTGNTQRGKNQNTNTHLDKDNDSCNC